MSSARVHTVRQLGWGQVTLGKESSRAGTWSRNTRKMASVMLRGMVNAGGTGRHRPSYVPRLPGKIPLVY